MSISNFNITLASARSATNGRGTDNAAAKAARSLGYTVVQASEGNKFVEVSNGARHALVAFYGSFGGFQLEVGSHALAAELIELLAKVRVPASMAYGTKAPRVAIGHTTDALGKALTVVLGELEPKAVQAPLGAIQAPVVQAPAVETDEDAEIAALEAKIAAKKAEKSAKAAKIAELKAQLAALESE